MDPVTAGIIGGGALLGGLGGGLFNMFGAKDANAANLKIAREQMKFQEKMSNTAYSRAVADMQNAGLNPAAMFASGAGTAASTPAGAGATMENELEGLGNNIANAPGQAATAVNEMANAAKTVAETKFVPEEKKNQIANTAADTLQKQAQTENIQAEKANIEQTLLKLQQETKQIKTNNDFNDAIKMADNSPQALRYMRTLMYQTGLTELNPKNTSAGEDIKQFAEWANRKNLSVIPKQSLKTAWEVFKHTTGRK